MQWFSRQRYIGVPQAIRCSRAQRNGFTVIELCAALMIASLVFAGIWGLLNGVSDGRDRIILETNEQDAIANRAALTSLWLENAEAGSDSSSRFEGSELKTSFDTSCRTEHGWAEPCRVTLKLLEGATGRDLVCVTEGGAETLRHFAPQAELRFLSVVNGEAEWREQWGTSIALPAAVAVVAGADTIVLGGHGVP